MKKAKKLIAGIMLACMVIVGAGVKPPDVFAATTTAAAGSLEMKTASDSINLNAGQSFDVTFSVNAETSGFGGYLTYDNSVFTSVTVVVDGGTTSGKTDNNGEWKASYNGYTHFLSVDYYKKDAAGNTTAQIADPVKVSGSSIATLKFTSAKPVIKTDITFSPSYLRTNGSDVELKTQKLTLTNSQAKTVTLSLGIVKGNGHISVPVYFSRNDGFNKIKLGISYNKNILAFQSVTLAPEVQSTLTQSDYNMSSYGGYLTTEYTAAADVNTSGNLMYIDFQLANGMTAYSNNGISTDVTVAIESVEDQQGDIFSYNSTTSSVTITDQQHTLGDVSGDGKVNLIDVLYVIQYYNNTKTFTSAEKTAADVNRDGKVDLTDALKILQYYNGAIKTLYIRTKEKSCIVENVEERFPMIRLCADIVEHL